MNKLTTSIFVIIIISALFIVAKPQPFFDEDGNAKNFGISSDETIIPFYIVSLFGGIISYLVLSFR